MCADAGLSIEETAKALHVTTRTVRYWISGRVGIPYAAYRLVRILVGGVNYLDRSASIILAGEGGERFH
jgi:DNA-binding transcriptional regulator YiaG